MIFIRTRVETLWGATEGTLFTALQFTPAHELRLDCVGCLGDHPLLQFTPAHELRRRRSGKSTASIVLQFTPAHELRRSGGHVGDLLRILAVHTCTRVETGQSPRDTHGHRLQFTPAHELRPICDCWYQFRFYLQFTPAHELRRCFVVQVFLHIAACSSHLHTS